MMEKFYSQNKDNDSKNQLDQQAQMEKLKNKLSLAEITIQDKDKSLKNLESANVQYRT